MLPMRSDDQLPAVPTMTMRTREYEPSDRDACMAVFDTNVPKYFVDAERDEFRRFLSELPGPYLLLEDDRGVVACGGYAFVPEEHRADLCWGMVRQELHNNGIGRQLTEARLQRAIADPRVRVIACNTSQLTTGFYEQLGFVMIERIPDGYSPGLDRCEMRLIIQ